MMQKTITNNKKTSLILQALREIFCRHITSLFPHTLLTITHLDFYAKEGLAKAHISILQHESPASIIEQLNAQSPMIRGFLGKRLASKLRTIPNVSFYLDTSLDKALHVQRLLKDIAVAS